MRPMESSRLFGPFETASRRREDIDDGRETAPSKRIRAAMPKFDKAGQGYVVAERIGLPTIRAECPRFDAWVRRLEALGTEPSAVPD